MSAQNAPCNVMCTSLSSPTCSASRLTSARSLSRSQAAAVPDLRTLFPSSACASLFCLQDLIRLFCAGVSISHHTTSATSLEQIVTLGAAFSGHFGMVHRSPSIIIHKVGVCTCMRSEAHPVSSEGAWCVGRERQ